MPARTKIQRTILHITAIIAGIAVVSLAVLVLVRMAAHSSRAEAASIIYYPNFCLGGWKYPQHASGPAAVSTVKFDAAAYTGENSAYLESSISSQLFCGYFSVKNAKNPPKKAVISFNWNFAFPDGGIKATSTDESYTSPEGYISIPAAGVMISATSTSATSTFQGNIPASSIPPSPQNIPATSSSTPEEISTSTSTSNSIDNASTSSNDQNGNISGTTEIPVVPNSAAAVDAFSQPTPTLNTNQSAPVDSSEAPPSASSDPAPTPEPTPTPAVDAPQSFNIPTNMPGSFGQSIFSFVTSLIAERVQAAEPIDSEMIVQSPLNSNAFKDFLEVSYSLDGIRWTAIGRVNKDNWRGYKVEIPVTSWDEVKRLQIMVSVLPTIDQKPDIYLDSMSMRAEYSQTVAELAAQGLAAVSNAVDSLIGEGNGGTDVIDIIPEEKKGPQPVEIRKKKLSFSLGGSITPILFDEWKDQIIPDNEQGKQYFAPNRNIKVIPNDDGSSLVISGSCGKKYFVVLTYRRENDYFKKPSSSVINEAHECTDGVFSYDMASLSPDTTRDGSQYLLIGEQDETGPWIPISDLYPIDINASTTIEIIYQ